MRPTHPLNLIAELTYRCPLRCPYCSNPLSYAKQRDDLATNDWVHIFEQASRMGIVHLGLTGGEPTLRGDLEELVRAAHEADLYTHLVTSARPIDPDGLVALAAAGLESVQISFQSGTAERSDRIAGTQSFEEKRALCEATRRLGLPLTMNVVLHRDNLDDIEAILELALQVGADRLELANTQYHGFALANRDGLLPEREQLEHASAIVDEFTKRHSRPRTLFVLPDYFSDRPKPCMGGWGQIAMVIDPRGKVLPCHDAGRIETLEFWSAKDRSLAECWHEAPGMRAFRGTEWMPEPCRSCDRKALDFGGCRCQAFALTGDAGATDPACGKAPTHSIIRDARSGAGGSWRYRGPGF